jgi:hypothetical protein
MLVYNGITGKNVSSVHDNDMRILCTFSLNELGYFCKILDTSMCIIGRIDDDCGFFGPCAACHEGKEKDKTEYFSHNHWYCLTQR